jgi:translocation and assembly module TamB
MIRARQLVSLIALLVLAAATAAILALRSRTFHQFVLRSLIRQGAAATGGRVEIGDFTFYWSSLRMELYRVTLHGTEAASLPPLFQANHVGVALRVVSWFGRKINVREIVVDRPVAHLFVDPSGHSNLPQPPPGTKPANVFDLAIGRLLVQQGEIYYNNRPWALNAELHDFQTHIAFDPAKTEYAGDLSYRRGKVQVRDFHPLEHDLRAQFAASPAGLTVRSLELESSVLHLTAAAQLHNYSTPTIDASYQAVLAMRELGYALNQLLPAGRLFSEGTARYAGGEGKPLLDALLIEGRLRSPALTLDLPPVRSEVRNLSAEYRLRGGTLQARNVQAEVLGGRVAADLTMTGLRGKPETRLTTEIRGVELANASAALRVRPLERLAVSGRLDGSLLITWHGSLEELRVQSDATVTASAPPPAGGSAASVPLAGRVHLAYDAARNLLSFQQSELHTPQTRVELDGSIGHRSSLAVHLQTQDLREVDNLLLAVREALSPPLPRATRPERLNLAGSASFKGQIQGSVGQPRVSGLLSGANLRYQNLTIPWWRSAVDLSPSGIAFRAGELQTSQLGHALFEGAVSLNNWSYDPHNPISLRLQASLPVADVQRLAGTSYPLSGALSANLSLRGTLESPQGQGSVRLLQARAWGEPIQSLALQVQGTGSALQSNFNLRTLAGTANAKATYYPRSQGYEVELNVPGLRLERLEVLHQHSLELTGVVRLSARGRGNLRSPQLDAMLEAPQLEFMGERLDGLKAYGSLAHQQARLEVTSAVAGAAINARAAVNLVGDYEAIATFDTPGFAVGPLLDHFLPGETPDLHGETEVHGWLKGPVKHFEAVVAHLEIPRLSISYRSLELAAATPIRADYRGGMLAFDRAELKGTGSDLQLQAVVPVPGPGALRARATGVIDLHILQLLHPEWDSSGRVELDVAAQGTRASPTIRGSFRIVHAALQPPSTPLGIENLNGELELLGDRVNIKTLTAQSGGGNVSVTGFIGVRPFPQFNLGLAAKDVRLRYPEGVRAVLESDLSLNGSPDSAVLSGQMLIDRLSFTRAFDLARFTDQFIVPSAPARERFMQNLKLDVALRSSQQLGVVSSALSVQGSADLRIRGTAAEPVILGRVALTGGELFYNGRRYEVENGVIQFANPVRTEPVVNLRVTTVVDQFHVNLDLVGPLERLRTTYTSDPPLPPVDVINLLLTGQTAEAAAANPATPQGVVAQQLAGEVSSRLGKLAGISSLTIDPQIGGQGGTGTRLAIQQRVTRNLFLTFTTDVTNAQGQAFQVEYHITGKYSLSAARDQNGGYGFQVKVHKVF